MNRKIAIQVIGSVGLLGGFVFRQRIGHRLYPRPLEHHQILILRPGRPNNGLAGIDGARHSNSHSDRQPAMNSLSSLWKWCTPFSRFTE